MTPQPPVFDILRESRNLAADELLLAAIPQLQGDFRIWALDVLLRRQRPAALMTLVQRYGDLQDDCQKRLAEQIDLLEAALRETIRSRDQDTRLNSIEIVARSNSFAVAYLLSSALSGGSSTSRGRAANALRNMSAALARETAAGKWSLACLGQESAYYRQFRALSERRQLLVSALREALDAYDTHSRTTVLEAAASTSMYLEEELLATARKPHSKCWRAIMAMLRDDPTPALAPLAVQALRGESTATEVVKAISTCRRGTFMTAMFDHAWLLGDRRIHRGCRSIRRLAWLETDEEPLLNMTASQLQRAVRFLRSTRIPDDQKVQWYRSVLLADDKDKQRTALFAIIDIKNQAAGEVLEVMVDWGDADLAAIALRELVRRQPQEQATLIMRHHLRFGGTDGPPPDDAAGYERFEQYWEAFEQMGEALQESVGRRILIRDPQAIASLVDKVSSPDVAHRVRALRIINTLKLTDRFRESILRCTHDADRFVRSAALKTLSRLPDHTSNMILGAALSDPDRRVRANAIEALDESQHECLIEKITPSLGDADHRVRATAIKVLLKLKVREAAASLLELLRHRSRAHRISALWVIEKCGLATLVQQVSSIAEQDPDHAVRRRARRLLRGHRRRRGERRVVLPEPSPQEPPP